MWCAPARLRLPAALAGAALLCLSAVALSGCGVIGSAGAKPAARGVKIVERDFHIQAPRRLAAGDVRLSVYNDGPDEHELLVVRKGARPLPLRADGLTIDEDAVERSLAGGLEPGPPESVRELDVHLRPGRYVLYCNMSGHYMGGMYTTVVVG